MTNVNSFHLIDLEQNTFSNEGFKSDCNRMMRVSQACVVFLCILGVIINLYRIITLLQYCPGE